MTRQSGCSRRCEDPGVLGPQPSPRVARGRAGQPTPFAHGPHRNAQACDQQTHPAGKTCLWRRLQTTPIAGSPSLPALPPKAALPQTAQPQPLAWQAHAHSGTQTSPQPAGRNSGSLPGTTSPGPGWAGSSWMGWGLVDTTKGGVEGQELRVRGVKCPYE